MARKQTPSFDVVPQRQSWMIPKQGLDGEWYPLIRVGRHIPFGYEQDPEDGDILQPIPTELEMLEKAKLYLTEYSLRLVARWLTEQSGRYISHTGLYKRVNIEQSRRGAADAHRGYEKRYKEAAAKAEKLEKGRLGGRGTRKLTSEDDSTSES